MHIPRLKGSENDKLNDAGRIKDKKGIYKKWVPSWIYTTPSDIRYVSSEKKIMINTKGGWIQGVGYVYYIHEGIYHTTRTYGARYQGFFTGRQVTYVSPKEFRKYIEENTICLNNLGYKSLREKRVDLQRFKEFVCASENLRITVTMGA